MARSRTVPSYRIDPFDLRLFAAIAQEGSITAGARQVHLSLAAASTRLQNLEHAIGAALLLRSKQGVSLTDAGRTLLRHAGRLQRELESLHAEMAAHAQGVHSTVRVLCNTAAMTEHLPRRLGRFLVLHPDIDIDLRELGSHDVLVAMRQEQTDIGIVADYVGTEGLSTRLFSADQLVVLLPAGQGRPARQALAFVDLLDRPFVGLVADGVGVAVVPDGAAKRLGGDQVAVRPLSDAWATRQLLLCTAGDVPLGAGAAALFRFLAEPD